MNSIHTRMRILPALLAPAALAACSALRHNSYAPVPVLRHEPLRCVISTGADGVLPEVPVGDASIPADGPMVSLTLSLFDVEFEFAEELLGAQVKGVVALVCSSETASTLRGEFGRLYESRATVVAGPTTLRTHSGHPGSFTLAHQHAYIRACELQSIGTSATVDPEIGVISEGLRVSTRVDYDSVNRSHAVELELWLSELERPFPSVELRTGHDLTPIRVQVPSGILRHVTTSSVLGPDEALVFGGASLSVLSDGRALIGVLETRPETEGHATAPDAR